jgi:hypothetical protein
MKVIVRTHRLDLPTWQLADLARRLELAFSRLTGAIRVVECVVTDINGPRGGADKHVRLRVCGRHVGTVVVEDLGVDARVTVGRACVRAERALLRRLARRRVFVPVSVH